MSPPDRAPVTAALIDLLETATARPVGGGQLPGDNTPPFAVVYPLPGGDTWGPDYTDPHAGVGLLYQITCVAVDRVTVEEFADVVRHVMLDRDADGVLINPMLVTGMVVLDRELAVHGGVAEERGVFNAREQYLIHVTAG